MQILNGDLWSWHARSAWVVVTTNIGWSYQTNRTFAPSVDPVNNMGAGIALEAAQRFSELPRLLGSYYAQNGATSGVLANHRRRLIFLPVKPLLDDCPAQSWNQKASLDLIEKGLQQLASQEFLDALPIDVAPGSGALNRQYRRNVAIGLPGCGNGGLEPDVVLPLVIKHLRGNSRFVLVDRQVKTQRESDAL